MRRRWTIRSVFMLPILLCMAGWVWSANHSGVITCRTGRRSIDCGTERGAIYVGTDRQDAAADDWQLDYCGGPEDDTHFWPTPLGWSAEWPAFHFRSGFSFWGFAFIHSSETGIVDYRVGVPYWFLIIFFATCLILVWRKTTRREPGGAFPVETKTKEVRA